MIFPQANTFHSDIQNDHDFEDFNKTEKVPSQ